MQHLTEKDFSQHNKNLFLQKPKFCFVLFFTESCHFCKSIFPIFEYFSTITVDCDFFIINVEKNHRVVQISQKTQTPITFVPLLLLFNGGIPIAQFDSDESDPLKNIDKMASFLVENTKIDTSSNNETTIIPPYSLGVPGNVAKHKVCYLSYTNAYEK